MRGGETSPPRISFSLATALSLRFASFRTISYSARRHGLNGQSAESHERHLLEAFVFLTSSSVTGRSSASTARRSTMYQVGSSGLLFGS